MTMTAMTLVPLFLGNLRGWEWIIILVVILLLFGGKKIPELMKGLGKGVKSFKQGMKDAEDEIKGAVNDESSSKKEEK